MKNTVATVPIIPHFVLVSSFISGLISELTSSKAASLASIVAISFTLSAIRGSRP